ncbi:MAG: MFS transporter [Dehalococcoidales bacterium]|nr:MFS transporter [Dehalococcoidales bacterium]
MKKSGEVKEKNQEGKIDYFHGEAATSAMESAGIAYQSSSLIASGAEARNVAWFASIINLVLSLLCIKTPSIIERIGTTRKAMIILAFCSLVSWLPLILVPLFLGSINPLWFVLLWIVSLIPTTLASPLRDNWLASLAPTKSAGKYLGARLAISGATYLATFYVMGYVLDIFEGQIFQGFAAIFSLAFMATFASFILYGMIKAPPAASEQRRTHFGFLEFIREASRGNLKTFIWFVSLFTLSVNLCGPLYAVYMLKDLHFSYITFTAVISADYIARILSSTFWGKYADRTGNIRVLGIASHLIPFVPVLWLFSSNVAYLIAVQLLSGTLWAAFDLSCQNYLYKAAPEDKRLRYIAYHKSLNMLSMALGALSGAYLLAFTFPVFGSQILGLFLLSGVLRLVIVFVIFHKLVDLALPAGAPEIGTSLDWDSIIKTWSSKQGLFYQPESWTQFVKQSAATNPSTAGLNTTTTEKGLFHKPRAWAQYIQQSLTANKNTSLPNPTGLYYRPQAWTVFAKQSLTGESKRSETRTTSASALFYQPQAAAQYVESLIPEPTIANAHVAVAQDKKAIFYQPEAWKVIREQTPTTAKTDIETQIKPVSARAGLLHKPQAWDEYRQQALTTVADTIAQEVKPGRKAYFYQPQAWEGLREPSPMAVTASTGTEVRTVPTKTGLFYQPQGQASYRGKSPASALAAPIRGEAPSSRKALYYQPNAWKQYTRPVTGETMATETVIKHTRVKMDTIPTEHPATPHPNIKVSERSALNRSSRPTAPRNLKPALAMV